MLFHVITEFAMYVEDNCKVEHLYEERNDFKGVNANGEYRVNICLDNLKLSPYTREVILSNKCDVLLEMRSIYSSENVEIYYLTDDFENVDELMRHNNDFDVLACISDMLHALKRCEDYLIYPEELLLSPESIYYDEILGK